MHRDGLVGKHACDGAPSVRAGCTPFYSAGLIKGLGDCCSSSSSFSTYSAITRVMRSSKGAGSGALFGIHSGFAIYHLCDLEQITACLCASM